MDPRKVPSRPISKPKQLLVEGRTPELFFAAFLRYLGIEAEIHNFGSTSELRPFLAQFFSCMAREGSPQPRNWTKAKTFAFLASQDIYDPLVGRAAQKGIWPWSNPVFTPLKQFLLGL